jgi:hypothetical protein
MARQVGIDATSSTPKTVTRAQSTKGAAATNTDLFAKALVVEVINDPEEFKTALELDEEDYLARVKDIDVALGAPRGSLLYKAIDDQSSKELNIAYPFFSSHVMIPVHVGEQVWILETPDDYSYWLTRISANRQVEDVNFTHKDRELELPNKLEDDAKAKADTQKGQSKNVIPRMNDGAGGDMGGAKNAPEGDDTKALKENLKTSSHLEESVPRFTPRVGDLSLQGSNNTLINLSTDRGWSKLDKEFKTSNALEELEEGRGSIDIVAGRGMSEEELKPTTEKAKGTDPKRTAARLAENDMGKQETDKAPRLNEMEPNPAEGDPDFHLDSSRIYVSMKSPIDERFALEEEVPNLREGKIEPMDASCIAMKTNEFRIISRSDGSVRILKEKGDDNTPCSVTLLPDGTIHLSGEKIFFGKSSDDGGLNEGPGPGGSQPYIKFSIVEEYLTDMHKALDSFCSTLLTHTTPGYGAPSPQITSGAGELRAKLKTAQQKITLFQSERIFGE